MFGFLYKTKGLYINSVMIILLGSEVKQMEETESWNMAMAYYQRIDNILTYCMNSRMNNNGKAWHKGIQSLYCEVYPKMDKDQQKEAQEMLDNLTKEINEGKKKVPTKMFLDLELYLRTILERKGMLTPKRNTSGL